MSRRNVNSDLPGSVSKSMWSSSDMIPASDIPVSSRRGNTLVLVTAILVLLVIIATAFITRTQEGRKLAKSQQAAYERSDNVSILKDQLAKDIATSLFARPVDGAVQQDVVGALELLAEGVLEQTSSGLRGTLDVIAGGFIHGWPPSLHQDLFAFTEQLFDPLLDGAEGGLELLGGLDL